MIDLHGEHSLNIVHRNCPLGSPSVTLHDITPQMVQQTRQVHLTVLLILARVQLPVGMSFRQFVHELHQISGFITLDCGRYRRYEIAGPTPSSTVSLAVPMDLPRPNQTPPDSRDMQ